MNNKTNFELISDLYNLMDSKIKYKDIIDNVATKSINFTETYFGITEYLNSITDIHKDKIFPVLGLTGSDRLILCGGKYVKIDVDISFEVFKSENIFNTAQEVWEKVLIPEIESNYNIKVVENTPSTNNIKMISDLFNFLDTKIKYIDEIEEVVFRIPNYTKSIFTKNFVLKYVNDEYEDLLFPILELQSRRLLVIYNHQFLLVNTDTDIIVDDPSLIFNTPEEVWEKVVKPDVESNYGIVVED